MMTTVSGEGRGDILCKSRGSQPDWNKNHDEQCDGNVVNADHFVVLYIMGYEVLSTK
jgi:hypothetical protein